MNAKDRIMTYLNDYFGQSFSNRELAEQLALPTPSVRRTINELRTTGQVMADIYAEGRNTRWMAA
jgi:DNA-binding transcriptional regulator LsrR (DeoR family)